MARIIAAGRATHADILVGTMQGYSGEEVVTPADIIPLVEQFQRDNTPWFATVVWTRGTIIGPAFPRETIIKVTAMSNPLFPEPALGGVAEYATRLAEFLGFRLKQVRVYVSTYEVNTTVVEVL